jgi:predicted nucleic acid-binding protein
VALERGLADTSVFIARESGRALSERDLPSSLAVSVITLGELRAGVLAATSSEARDRRLSTLSAALSFDPLPIDARVADHWASLRIALRDRGLRMPVNDSWIAATAMAWAITLVTQDLDYVEVPGLEVLRV